MKAITTLMSVLALSVAGSAFAGGGPYPEPMQGENESAKSRAEVVAETKEASRLGLLTIGEEDARVATAEQEELILKAGRRAAEEVRVASGSRR